MCTTGFIPEVDFAFVLSHPRAGLVKRGVDPRLERIVQLHIIGFLLLRCCRPTDYQLYFIISLHLVVCPLSLGCCTMVAAGNICLFSSRYNIESSAF